MEKNQLAAGSEIMDALKVKRVIAKGASATIYEAMRREQNYALKLGHDFSERPFFVNEALIYQTISGPHIPKMWMTGTFKARPFILMDLYQAPSLADICSRESFEAMEVLRIADQLLEALGDIHQQGVTHCDVKPENIILYENPSGRLILKLIDFGISRASFYSAQICEPNLILGTPHYLSPEVIRGEAVGPRNDLYAVGVILYEMLTGRMPFAGETNAELLHTILLDAPRPPSVFRDRIPRLLDNVVLRAISRNEKDRYCDANEMREALLRCQRYLLQRSSVTRAPQMRLSASAQF